MCRVDLLTGRLSLSELDFEIPGLIPLVLKRHYRSTNIRRGDLGHGWGHSLGSRLWHETDQTLLLQAADGRRFSFALPTPDEPLVHSTEAMSLHLLPGDELPWPALRRPLAAGAFVLNAAGQFTLLFDATAADNGSFAWRGIADASKNLLTIVPGADGLPAQLHDTQGRTLHITRDQDGFLTEIRLTQADDPSSDTTLIRYEYDAREDLVAAHDAAGTRLYEYQDHRLVRRQDRCRSICESVYDDTGRCTRVSGPDSVHARTYAYDPETKTATIRDSQGNVSSYIYGDDRTVVKTIDESGGTSSFDYDDKKRIVRTTDQMGNETVIAFDENGAPVGKVSPDGSAAVVETNSQGKVTRFISPTGAVSEFERDELGRAAKITKAGRGDYQIDYADDGSIQQMQIPSGKKVELKWSADRRRLTELDDEGILTEQHFDARGQLVLHRDAVGATTKYQYDRLGYLAEITNPDSTSRHFTYDGEGHLLEMRDEAGGSAQWHYDAAGRRVSATLPSGEVIQCEFDTEDRITGIQSPDGLWHRYEYDPRGLVDRQTFSDGRTERYAYDGRGLLAEMADPAGDSIRIERDPVGRVVRITYPGGAEKTMEYDEAGLWTRVEWQGHVLDRELSAEGHALEEQRGDYSLFREVDEQGQLLSVVDSLGRRVAYSYDENGRVETIEVTPGIWEDEEWSPDGTPRTHEFEYDRVGNLTCWKMPGGKVEQRTYDLRRRMTQQTVTRDEELILKREYTYDALGRVQTLRDSRRGVKHLSYDALGRLQSVRQDGEPDRQFRFSSEGDLLLDGLRYGPAHQVRGVGQDDVEYDERGFVVRRGSATSGREYRYTVDGLLQSVRKPDGKQVDYQYDGHARLIEKWTAEHQWQYFWNGEWLWAMQQDDAPPRELLYMPGSLAPLEQSQGEQFYSVHTDHLGRVLELIDEEGNVVYSDTAGVWGDGRQSSTNGSGQIECPIGMPGQVWDGDSGLYYNRYRFYWPETAHYLTPDPIGIWGGSDAYRYLPDPVNFMDPMGLKCRGETDDDILYRADARPPSEICSQGFQPRNPTANVSLRTHVNGVPGGGSNWVSTTHDMATADRIAEDWDRENVYVVSNPGCGEEVDCNPDVMEMYGPDPPGTEHEIAFNRAIPPENIIGFYQPGAGGLASFQACP